MVILKLYDIWHFLFKIYTYFILYFIIGIEMYIQMLNLVKLTIIRWQYVHCTYTYPR